MDKSVDIGIPVRLQVFFGDLCFALVAQWKSGSLLSTRLQVRVLPRAPVSSKIMNKLEYKIEVPTEPYDDFFRILIDGRETGYYFDVAGMELSRIEGGVCPIFVCGCGYIGCTGYYVLVERDGENVVWSKFYEGFYDYSIPPEENEEAKGIDLKNGKEGVDGFIAPPFVFDAEEYSKMIDALIAELPNCKPESERFQRELSVYKAGDRFRM